MGYILRDGPTDSHLTRSLLGIRFRQLYLGSFMDPVQVDLNSVWNSVVTGFWNQAIPMFLHWLPSLLLLLLLAVVWKLFRDLCAFYFQPRPMSLNRFRSRGPR